MTTTKMNTTISIVGLAVIFVMAYGSDQWAELLQRQARENFNFSPYYWFLSIDSLVLACSILTLGWLVCFRDNRRWLTSLIFIIVGLFAEFAFAVDFSILAPSSHYMITPFFLNPNSRVADVGAFVVVTGFARLLIFKND